MTIWKFFAHRADNRLGYRLLICRRSLEGVVERLAIVDPLAFTDIPADSLAPQVSVIAERESEDFLRAALNCAWDMGFRPDGYLDTSESLAATRRHLADMRAIAFHALEAPVPLNDPAVRQP